jgi:hypothetical protein
MKIELSQRDTIFAQLKKKRKWSGRRNGHKVRIWTEDVPMGLRIRYQVTRRHVNVSGHCFSLTRAIEYVNQVLEPHQVIVAPPETLPLVAAAHQQQKRQEWLPYADN